MVAIAEGTIKSAGQGGVVLAPRNTNYEIRLGVDGAFEAGRVARGMIMLKAVKVWTIPAGGNFVSPLVGEPRVVQGVVKSVEGERVIVQAGFPVCVTLPADTAAYDLKNGGLLPGVMVNITIAPGAKFQIA